MSGVGDASHVTKVVGPGGELTPVIVAGELRIPIFGAAVFAAERLRRPGGSPHTDAQALTSIACWENYKVARGIDWEDRVQTGKFLLPHEVSDFARYLRMPRGATDGAVQPSTVTIRIGYAIPYISWEIDSISARDWRSSETFEASQHAADTFLERLYNAQPKIKPSSEPRSLTAGQSDALHELMNPEDGVGIWRDQFVANRNGTYHAFLDETGNRMGEALSMRLRDWDFETGAYRICKRPEDASDPRSARPLVKGFSRKLEASTELTARIRNYVYEHRAGRPMAAGHDWVFVSCDGLPWSSSGVLKMCERVRRARPDILGNYTSHVMRHTWNDRFSEEIDHMGVSEEAEIKARMHAMGWLSPRSARTYNKRHDQKVASEVSINQQKRVTARRKGGDV